MTLVTYLVGSGHFAFGFTIGFLLMLILNRHYSKNIQVQIYSPFLPFIIGIYAALPYLFINSIETGGDSWNNIFVFYNVVHHHDLMIKIFGRLNLVAVICGSMYLYILFRYIALVKYCRRYGWKKGI